MKSLTPCSNLTLQDEQLALVTYLETFWICDLDNHHPHMRIILVVESPFGHYTIVLV